MFNTHNFIVVVALFVGLCSLSTTSVVAQRNVLDSDPLRARKLLVYDQYGAYGGFNFNNQGGTLITDCNCQFTGGAATSYVAGIVFERLTRAQYFWGVALGIENRSFQSRFREREQVMQRAPSSQTEYQVPVNFLNIADMSLTYLTLNPYGKLTFFDALFVRSGPSVSYIISSSLKHTKELIDEKVQFPNGETATVALTGSESNSVVLQDGDFEAAKLQVGLNLAAGLDLELAKGFYFSPYLQYNMPFTSVSGQGNGFSVRAFQLLVECRWIL